MRILRTGLIILFIFSLAFAEAIYKKVCFKNTCVRAEVVDTDFQRQAGLMFRKRLPRKHAMLFVFEKEAIYPFWMKNMKFALDIIWLSEEKQVVYIVSDVLPCDGACKTILPNKEAKYVLEVGSGFIEKHNIKIGDQVRF